MTDEITELNKKWAALVRSDIAAARDVIEWSTWDAQDWIDSIVEEIETGVHDEGINAIDVAVKARFEELGLAPSTTSGQPFQRKGKYDVSVGQQYVIRTGRRDRWEGVVVEVTSRSRSRVRCRVVKEGLYRAKRGATPITVGMSVNIDPNMLHELPAGVQKIGTKYDCIGWFTVAPGGTRVQQHCPNKSEMDAPGQRCTPCVEKSNAQIHAEQERVIAENKKVLEAAAAEERRVVEAKRRAAEKAEANKPKPGQRRVMRRGF